MLIRVTFAVMDIRNFYSNKYIQPLLHILFWGLLIFSPYLFRNEETWNGFNDWQLRILVYKVLLAILFYFNMYFLYPVIYKKRGIGIYILFVLLTIAVLISLSFYLDRLIFSEQIGRRGPPIRPGRQGGGGPPRHNDGEPSFDIFLGWIWSTILPYLFVSGISFSYSLFRDSSKEEKLKKERENENLKTELSFLRSQVSPHFIFNVLNNMVSLARKKSDLLEPSLIQLSNLIRYMLYENDEEKVSLQREVEYLHNYIDLQLLRFGDDVNITFHPQKNLGGYVIEPMLLTAFVENAFKHGVGMVENPHIDITLNVDEETGWMDFKVMNAVAPQQDTKDKSSGIGLVNVKRRLELLYHENYNLDIMHTESVFIASLKIKLK